MTATLPHDRTSEHADGRRGFCRGFGLVDMLLVVSLLSLGAATVGGFVNRQIDRATETCAAVEVPTTTRPLSPPSATRSGAGAGKDWPTCRSRPLAESVLRAPGQPADPAFLGRTRREGAAQFATSRG